MSSVQFFRCRCYLTNNYFLKKYNIHVMYINKKQVQNDYEAVLDDLGCKSESDWAEVYDVRIARWKDATLTRLHKWFAGTDRHTLEAEFCRRSNADVDSQERRLQNVRKYVPLHPEIYELQESFLEPVFVRLAELCKQDIPRKEKLASFTDISKGKELYTFRVFTTEFCQKLVEEIINFEESPLPKGRPNTMNNYGILLDEMGMDDSLITPLRENYLAPISSVLFPFWTGDTLDSHRAFIVTYRMDNDVDLNRHYDNAEVTLNVCLGTDFKGGELYFAGMQTEVQDDSTRTIYHNKPFVGLLHRARHIHGALPILSGLRYNLIIWMRSSSVRNRLCPMCMEEPLLVPSHKFGDGFTKSKTEVKASSS